MLSSPSPGPYCGCTAISLCGTTDLSECSSADATVYWTFEGDHTEAYQTHVYIYEKDAITDDIVYRGGSSYASWTGSITYYSGSNNHSHLFTDCQFGYETCIDPGDTGEFEGRVWIESDFTDEDEWSDKKYCSETVGVSNVVETGQHIITVLNYNKSDYLGWNLFGCSKNGNDLVKINERIILKHSFSLGDNDLIKLQRNYYKIETINLIGDKEFLGPYSM